MDLVVNLYRHTKQADYTSPRVKNKRLRTLTKIIFPHIRLRTNRKMIALRTETKSRNTAF